MTATPQTVRVLASCFVGVGLLAGIAGAQEPAAPAGGVAIEFGGEPAPAKVSARDRAKEYLKEKGLKEGWNASKGLWIAIGNATIAQLPGTDEWDQARYVAFEQACRDAKTKAAERIGAGVSASMKAESATGTDLNEERKKVFAEDANAEGARQLGVIDKVAAIVEAEVDKAYKARVPGANAAPTPEQQAARDAEAQRVRRQLTADLLKQSSFKSAVSVVAEAELCGMQCFRTFEEIPPGKQGAIAVIMTCNKTSLALASALMGKSDEAPSGAEGTARTSIGAWADSLDEKTLLYTMGCQIRQNENGEVVLVAFGQATPTVDDEDLIDEATRGASLVAFAEARRFVGELVKTRGTRTVDQQLAVYRQRGIEGVEKEAQTRKQQFEEFESMADELMMRGADDVREWDERHPLSTVPTQGVIKVFSLSGARDALAMKDDMEAVGGSKGGAGVRPAAAGGKPAAGAPTAPAGLKVAADAKDVRLAWEDNSSNEQGFVIERSVDGRTDWKELGRVNAGIRVYPLPAALSAQKGFYRVRAFNAAGQSAPAGPVEFDGKVAPAGGPHGGSSGAGAEPDLP